MHRTRMLALLLAAGMLCSGCGSGAISNSERIFRFTSSSTMQLWGKNSPPCATR